MSSPLVSIVLPAFNHESYVRKTLDSMIEQDYPNTEILIINDGSTDSTGKVISTWIEDLPDPSRVRYVDRENRGVTATANELLAMARGEYIAGASSDDFLLPHSVKVRVEYLQRHPSKLAVFGDYLVVDENDEVLHESGIQSLHHSDKADFETDEGMRRSFLQRFSVAGPVLMFDRRIFREVGMFDESLHIEDWDMYLRMSARNLLGFVDAPLAAYRLHSANISATYFDGSLARQIEHHRYMKRVLGKNRHCFEDEDRRLIDQRIRKLRAKIGRNTIARYLERLRGR